MSGVVIHLQVRAWGFWHRVAKAGGTSWYKYESVRLIAEPLGEAKIILTWITKAVAQKGHNHSYRHLCAKPHGSALTYCEAHSHLWWIWVPSLLQHWPFCSRLSPEILGYRKRKASGERKVKVIVIQFFSLFFFFNNVSFLQYSRLMNGPFDHNGKEWITVTVTVSYYCHNKLTQT